MCICVVFVVCVVGLCGAWQGVKILEECTDMEDRDKWVQVSGWTGEHMPVSVLKMERWWRCVRGDR